MPFALFPYCVEERHMEDHLKEGKILNQARKAVNDAQILNLLSVIHIVITVLYNWRRHIMVGTF